MVTIAFLWRLLLSLSAQALEESSSSIA